MTFKIRRLNMEHKAEFALRGHANLSRSIIATYQEKAPQYQQVIRFVRQPHTIFDVMAALITRSLIVSLVVLTPVAQAHAKAKAKAKKRTIVAITFDAAAPTQEPAVRKARVTEDSKISRTLRPVDRYADDSADQVITEDTTDTVEPLRTIASVQQPRRAKGPISASAGISDSLLENTPLEQNTDIPSGSVEFDNGQNFEEESEIGLTADYSSEED